MQVRDSCERFQQSQGELYTIIVKRIGQVTRLQLDLSVSPTVEDLMLAIKRKEGIPLDQMCLVGGGVRLAKQACLKTYIHQGLIVDKVHLILMLRGC